MIDNLMIHNFNNFDNLDNLVINNPQPIFRQDHVFHCNLVIGWMVGKMECEARKIPCGHKDKILILNSDQLKQTNRYEERCREQYIVHYNLLIQSGLFHKFKGDNSNNN